MRGGKREEPRRDVLSIASVSVLYFALLFLMVSFGSAVARSAASCFVIVVLVVFAFSFASAFSFRFTASSSSTNSFRFFDFSFSPPPTFSMGFVSASCFVLLFLVLGFSSAVDRLGASCLVFIVFTSSSSSSS